MPSVASPAAAATPADPASLEQVVRDIGIPSCPKVLVDLRTELARDEPRLPMLAGLASSDVALSAGLLKLANSALMGLSRKVDSVEQAFVMLGMQTCMSLLTEIVLRKTLPSEGLALTRFWDVSAKRAHAMSLLARHLIHVDGALAHSVGLFCDSGIPILIRRYVTPASYLVTLAEANQCEDRLFTDVEQARHRMDHTIVGGLLANMWGLSAAAQVAIRSHHDYSLLAPGSRLSEAARELVALSLIVERIIQTYAGLNRHVEWEKGGAAAMGALELDAASFKAWEAEAHALFDRMG